MDIDQTIIKSNPYFSILSDEDFAKLLQHISVLTIPAQHILFHEGDFSDAFYIVKEGAIRISSVDSHGNNIFLARVSDGGFFGEQAFSAASSPRRRASAIAQCDTVLYQFPRDILLSLLRKDTQLQTILQAQDIKYLKAKLFKIAKSIKHTSYDIRKDLHPNKIYPKRSVIYFQNDEAAKIYMLVNGEIELRTYDENKQIKQLVSIGAGQLFGETDRNNLTQIGTALYDEEAGGPLDVVAKGTSDDRAVGIGGAHIGVEFQDMFAENNARWNARPAVELEGYYLNVKYEGSLINPTNRLPEHDFIDTLPINGGVILANFILDIKMPCVDIVRPYIGGGLGTAFLSVSDADSEQISPPEPGINHFNSGREASRWTFAAQAKAGLRFIINPHWQVFAEYRYLYLDESHYTFGSTQYPTHVATTRWKTSIGSNDINMGVAGFEYKFS